LRCRFHKAVIVACSVLLLAGTASAAPRKGSSQRAAKRHQTSAKAAKAKTSKKAKQGWRTRQNAPDSARVRQIQAALIREHYLDGEATGQWDARTKLALQKLQAENGWQTKRIPDSRALIRLGLGPDRAKLMNPDTASLAPAEVTTRGGNQ
jgi:hypothetical protein